jgi:hypothetical protein
MTLRPCSDDSDIEMVESFDGLLEGAGVRRHGRRVSRAGFAASGQLGEVELKTRRQPGRRL